MARRQGGTLSGFTPLSTPNAPTDLSVSTSIGSASVSFTAPTDTGDGAVTSYIVTAIDESTGASSGVTGTESPITISPGGGTFKIRAQAVNGFGAGRLTEFDTGNQILSGAELYTWGSGYRGRLGDGTIVNKSSPIQVGSLTTWSMADAGRDHALATRNDGTLWAWGRNNFAQLGINVTGSNTESENRSSPVQVGVSTDWLQPSGAYQHSAAVKSSGTLWSWGRNEHGQLGHNNVTYLSSPVQVGALTTWSQVSAATFNTGAIKTDGSLWMWGINTVGGVGDNTTISRSSPVQVGALTNWAFLSVGSYFAVALKTDGTMWSWGSGGQGRLGDNTAFFKSSPVQIGSLATWARVSTKDASVLAVSTNGTLWAWGENDRGQLGIGNNVNTSSPTQVGALTTWKTPGSFYKRSGCIRTNGTLFTWGFNSAGELGHNNTISRSSPVQVGALATWHSFTSGSYHSVALLGVL